MARWKVAWLSKMAWIKCKELSKNVQRDDFGASAHTIRAVTLLVQIAEHDAYVLTSACTPMGTLEQTREQNSRTRRSRHYHLRIAWYSQCELLKDNVFEPTVDWDSLLEGAKSIRSPEHIAIEHNKSSKLGVARKELRTRRSVPFAGWDGRRSQWVVEKHLSISGVRDAAAPALVTYPAAMREELGGFVL